MDRKIFNIYPLLITLMVTGQILCFIYARSQIDIFGFPINASGIIFPLDIYLIEIIGECYGFEYSRQAVYLDLLVHILFIPPVFLISKVPYSDFMHNDLAFSYKYLIDISWIVASGSLIGTFLGDLFSAKYVPKLKLVLNGEFTFFRLIGCQIVSEIIVTSSYFISYLSNNYTILQTIHLVLCTLFVKSILAILLFPLAKIAILLIKRFEKFDVFDFKQDYKTMAFIINQDKIMLRDINIKK